MTTEILEYQGPSADAPPFILRIPAGMKRCRAIYLEPINGKWRRIRAAFPPPLYRFCVAVRGGLDMAERWIDAQFVPSYSPTEKFERGLLGLGEDPEGWDAKYADLMAGVEIVEIAFCVSNPSVLDLLPQGARPPLPSRHRCPGGWIERGR